MTGVSGELGDRETGVESGAAGRVNIIASIGTLSRKEKHSHRRNPAILNSDS